MVQLTITEHNERKAKMSSAFFILIMFLKVEGKERTKDELMDFYKSG